MSATTASRPGPSGVPRWASAVALAVLWHLLVAAGMIVLDPFSPDPDASSPPPIQLTFSPTAPVAERPPDDSLPRNFTELPEDRADLPPERADALSNVDSRARDAVEDGPATDLPRSEGRAENPAVAMSPVPDPGLEGTEPDVPPEPVTPAPEDSAPEEAPPTAEESERIGRRADIGESLSQEATGGGEPAPRTEIDEGVGRPGRQLRAGPRVEVSPEPRFRIGAGTDEIVQEALNNPKGNAQLFGDISLNTVAWDWAPWLQRFTRDFYRNWVPPYAYYLGLIDGNHLLELEIAPDGRLLKLEVLEETGHESLLSATEGNFRGLAPYQPLPGDFPEPTLRMTVRVTYYGRE